MHPSIHPYIHPYIHTCMHAYHTYIHTYILTHIHTYAHIHRYVRTYVRTYVHTYIRTYVHTYTRTHVHTYIRTYVPTYLRAYVPTYIRTYVHVHTYIRTYVHTYIHNHTYTLQIRICTYIYIYICLCMLGLANGAVLQGCHMSVVFSKAEIKKWRGVKLCQDEPILTTPAPPAPSACICIFDVDRTLTGKQGLAEGSQCPANKIVDGVWDTAYGGGILTLSAAAQNLKRRLRGEVGRVSEHTGPFPCIQNMLPGICSWNQAIV